MSYNKETDSLKSGYIGPARSIHTGEPIEIIRWVEGPIVEFKTNQGITDRTFHYAFSPTESTYISDHIE